MTAIPQAKPARLVVLPGPGLVARRNQIVLFLAQASEPAAAELLATLWIDDAARVPDALFDVVRSRRPDHVSAFCALFLDMAETRVAIHGRMEVVAQVGADRVQLRGRDPGSRVEDVIAGPIAAIAAGPEVGQIMDAPLLDLVSGVVSGGSIHVIWVGAPAGGPEVGATVVGGMPPPAAEAETGFVAQRTMAMPQPQTPVSGPVVDGVMCPNGHFNSPDAATCRICGLQPGDAIVRMPRPPLGRLRTIDGREYIVDRPLIVGRKANLAPEVLSGEASGIEVDENQKDVSRMHAAFVLEGWSVLVRDLSSANGTHFLPAGVQEWFRVEPDHPVEIVPGTVIAVGTFELRFENL